MATVFRPPLIVRGSTPSPAVAIAAQSNVASFPLSLLGKDTFFAGSGMGPEYDYPNPRTPLFPSSNRTHLDSFKLTLIGKDTIYGAAGEGVPQRDWPVPRAPTYPSHLRTFTDPLKVNLLGKDQFFGAAGMPPRFDYPNPRGPTFPSHLRSYTDPLKLNLLGQDKFFGGAGQPPKNLEWAVPRGYPPRPHAQWSSPATLTFRIPAPFAQLNWPLPTARADPRGVAVRAWNDTWQNIATIHTVLPPAQYDWPVPRGATYPSDLRVHYPTAFVWQRGFDQITDTDILQLPVNVVMAGDVPIKDGYREYDIRPANFRTKTTLSATPSRRLRGGRPSFTVKTDKKGYD